MFLLALMAYDCYVVICNPLLYLVIMSQKVCMQLVADPYLYSFSVAFFHTVVTFWLIYYGSNVINHFYCDDVPLMALACSDTSLKEILIFIFAEFNMISSLTTSLFLTYTLWLPSWESNLKRGGTKHSQPVVLIWLLSLYSTGLWSSCICSPNQTIPLTQTKWPLSSTK